MIIPYIRSILIHTTIVGCSIVVGGSLLIPSLLSRRAAQKTCYYWGSSIILICQLWGIKFKVEGKENLKKGSVIIASKHESAWETMFFFYLFKTPSFVFKKGLLWTPIAGQYLYMSKMIYIDRQKGKGSINKIIAQCKEIIKDKRSVVIFPQGTRTKPKAKMSYKSGIYAIAKETNLPVIPVVLNSGSIWPKNLWVTYKGVITVKILPAITNIEDKKKFMNNLEDKIETAYKKL